MPSILQRGKMTDKKLDHYFYWCYDCNELIHEWMAEHSRNSSHTECRNIRILTMPEYIDTINMIMKDSSLFSRHNSEIDQVRLSNMKFIYTLIKNHSVKSGNENQREIKVPIKGDVY